MLKGTQKKLIMMQTVGSPLFETAYFVLKEQDAQKRPSKDEMLKEANRILEENKSPREKAAAGRRQFLIGALFGFLAGQLFLALLWLSSLS